MNEPTKRDIDGRRESERVLRAKYHDYCSAQVADTLMGLSPDEIFVLAQEAPNAVGVGDDLTYDRAVQLATVRVSRTIDLPPFEAWLEDYQADPARYEGDLMGLWEADTQASDSD